MTKLKDYTDTELVEEIKARITNNSIETQSLLNLLLIVGKCIDEQPDLYQKMVDKVLKKNRLENHEI